MSWAPLPAMPIFIYHRLQVVPHRTAPVQKLTVPQLVQKFPALYVVHNRPTVRTHSQITAVDGCPSCFSDINVSTFPSSPRSFKRVSSKFPHQQSARIAPNISCVHVTQLLYANDTTFTGKYKHLTRTHNGKQTNTLYSRAPTTCSSLTG